MKRSRPVTKLFLSAGCAVLCGCGVKGDPIPPGTPAEIGRGKPTFHESADSNTRRPPLALPKKTKDADDDVND